MSVEAGKLAGEIMRRARSSVSEREGVVRVDDVDLALEHSFPTSDPPAWMWRGGAQTVWDGEQHVTLEGECG